MDQWAKRVFSYKFKRRKKYIYIYILEISPMEAKENKRYSLRECLHLWIPENILRNQKWIQTLRWARFSKARMVSLSLLFKAQNVRFNSEKQLNRTRSSTAPLINATVNLALVLSAPGSIYAGKLEKFLGAKSPFYIPVKTTEVPLPLAPSPDGLHLQESHLCPLIRKITAAWWPLSPQNGGEIAWWCYSISFDPGGRPQ